MAKKRAQPQQPEIIRVPKKKGRPRKYPINQPKPPLPHTDEQAIQKFLKQAILARKIANLLELY